MRGRWLARGVVRLRVGNGQGTNDEFDADGDFFLRTASKEIGTTWRRRREAT
jgi:hypothetical protein